MFHPPLLRIVPMALIAVIVLSLVFVTVDGLGVFGAERLETLLIRSLRSLGNPDRMIGPPIVEESMRDFSALGGYAVLIMVSICFSIFALVELSRETFRFFVVTVVGGFFLNVLLKSLVQRDRPAIVPHLSLVEGSTSFPSAHATMSVVVFVTIGLVLSTRTRDRHLQRLFSIFPVWLSFVIGVSRVCMGVHYPTDILGGWALGLLWTWAAFRVRLRILQGAAGGS
jgi:undecaprenyl-diphosphatase